MWSQHYFEQCFTSKSFYPQLGMSWHLKHPPAKTPTGKDHPPSAESLPSPQYWKLSPSQGDDSRQGTVLPSHTTGHGAGKAPLSVLSPSSSACSERHRPPPPERLLTHHTSNSSRLLQPKEGPQSDGSLWFLGVHFCAFTIYSLEPASSKTLRDQSVQGR